MTTDIDIVRARVDKHGRILDEHGKAIDGLALVVLGDSQKHVRGLLQRTDDLEKLTQEVRDWRVIWQPPTVWVWCMRASPWRC